MSKAGLLDLGVALQHLRRPFNKKNCEKIPQERIRRLIHWEKS
jgi:hypothetical protein